MALSPVCGALRTSPTTTGKENVQHGTVQFPIACYHYHYQDNDGAPRVSVPWHWHEEFEIIIVVEGQLEVCIEKERLSLLAKEAVFINSEMLHSITFSDTGTATVCCSVMHPRLIGGSMDSVFWQRLVKPLLQNSAFKYYTFSYAAHDSTNKEIYRSFMEAWNVVVSEQDDYENIARYQLSRGIRLLTLSREKERPFDRKLSQQEKISAERIKTMISYIEKHFTEELTLEKIAASILVSKSACLRCFKQILGLTPIQYVKQYRVEKAAELLSTTNMTAQEVCFECGFTDSSYFTKVFRESKGYSPKKYQELFKNGGSLDSAKNPATQEPTVI